MSSCNFVKDTQDFTKANDAVHQLYLAYNNEKSLEDVKLDSKTYGKFNDIVNLEKSYLQNRKNQEDTINKLSDQLDKFDFNKGDAKEYFKLIDEAIKLKAGENDKVKAEDNKLIKDIESLKISSTYIKDYIKDTKERIKFEEKYRKKLNELDLDILKKTKEYVRISYLTNPTEDDEKKLQNLEKEIDELVNNYNKIADEEENEINKMMQSKEKK